MPLAITQKGLATIFSALETPKLAFPKSNYSRKFRHYQ